MLDEPVVDLKPEEIPSFKWPVGSPMYLELKRWDTPKSQGGMRCDGYEAFPAMLYKASRRVNENGAPVGPYLVIDPNDEQFSARNQRVARNESELLLLKGQGWCEHPADALKRANEEEDEIARVTAHRHYEDKRLSEAAQAEAKAADDASFEHVPAIPEKRRRGRPRKMAPVQA